MFGEKDEIKLVFNEALYIKVYFNELRKNVSNGNLYVPVHSSLLEELRGLLICASYIAMQNLLESGLPRGSASYSNFSSAAALPAHQASL